MKMPQVLGNLCAKFGAISSKGLAVAVPNVQRYPNMQNFGTFFSNFETFFSLLGSSYPSETLELGCYTSYELASPFSQNWHSYFSFFFKKKGKKSRIAKFWKISKLNISKTIKPRLLKFDMCVDVGHLYIHAKFCDPEGLRIAYMPKKPKFWLFWALFGFFLPKNDTYSSWRYSKFCMKKRLSLENLYAKFGAAN